MPENWYRNTDPHDLVGDYKRNLPRSVTVDVWDVWVCDPVAAPLYVEAFPSLTDRFGYTSRMVADWLNYESSIDNYFHWLSDGKYDLLFMDAGFVSPDLSDRSFSEYSDFRVRHRACEDAVVSAAGESEADGGLIVDTTRTFGTVSGTATAGKSNCAGENGCVPYTDPNSHRFVFVDGSVWVDAYIHEIGHSINWSHSYFAVTGVEHPSEYTNPMDVMSGSTGWLGTIAINRYAAGWIDPDDVKVWTLGDRTATFRLNPVRVSGGYQMLVIRDGHNTSYYTFGARVRAGYDRHIPQEGVEWYIVDESKYVECGWTWCSGARRQITTIGKPRSTDHVLTETESVVVPLWDGEDWVDVLVWVEKRRGDSFDVLVSYE